VKLGDLAFAQRDDLHAREAEMLEPRRHGSLVAPHTIQALGQHALELAALSVLQERLMPGRGITLASETAASL
jgi:hypothetical protein